MLMATAAGRVEPTLAEIAHAQAVKKTLSEMWTFVCHPFYFL